MKVFLLCILLSTLGTLLFAEDSKPDVHIKKNTIIVPQVYKPFESRSSFSISFIRLPIDWVETSIDAPIIQFSNKLGLPAGFSLESNIQSIYVSNQFRIGPRWNIEAGRFSFAAGLDAGLLFGSMKVSGFNNKAVGWMVYPTATIGFTTNDIAFTISAERNTLQSLKISSGNAVTSDFRNFKSGQTFSVYMEQRLWDKHVLILGFMNNFQKFYFPAWPAFSAFNRRYYIPQLYIGLVL